MIERGFGSGERFQFAQVIGDAGALIEPSVARDLFEQVRSADEQIGGELTGDKRLDAY